VVSLPRLVIAAPGSGHGKTTVATGLMAALRDRGLAVSGHKIGPDYIDPGYHALATGRPGRNLDPVLCGADLMVPLLRHGAAGADIAVVEGVMGLFDGRGHTGEGSTAHVAQLIGAPVLLVVDAAGLGRSVAALAAGFAGFEPGLRLGGVLLNRVGSDRHEDILRDALAGTGIPVLGALRRDDQVAVPSRHLGLIPAAERQPAAQAAVRRLAALVGQSVDLDAVLALARTATPLTTPPWSPPSALPPAPAQPAGPPPAPAAPLFTPAQPAGPPPIPTGPPRISARPVIAVAGGSAFTFGYAETAELLTAAGAEVVAVDPLRDETLPPGTAGLVLGGGFPEEHASDLSANTRLRDAVARLARSGAPVIAECAGLLYLAQELDGRPMCGVLPVTGQMTSRLTLGYRDAVAAADSVLAPAGLAVRGHEFHRTAVSPASNESPAWTLGDRPEGFVHHGVHASYLHLHWAARPELAARFVRAAA
jgi:cobyrinic acid a,c-diamide synthase